jgi:hypothetical protein
MVTYDSHWVVASLAAERRQSLAKAEGRGFGYKQAMRRRATKESFAATAAYGSLGIAPRPFGAVAETQRSAIFPSSPRRGGRDINKISRSLLYGADGMVIQFHRISLRLNTTPSARAKDASRHFLDRAATPPRRGGENSPLQPFGQQPLSAVAKL